MDSRIDKHVAACLYTGIVTDTGSFRFSNTGSETMRIAATLMDKGINHVQIFDSVMIALPKVAFALLAMPFLQKMEVLREYNTVICHHWRAKPIM
jgi:phosphoesterase RecJ-like protein